MPPDAERPLDAIAALSGALLGFLSLVYIPLGVKALGEFSLLFSGFLLLECLFVSTCAWFTSRHHRPWLFAMCLYVLVSKLLLFFVLFQMGFPMLLTLLVMVTLPFSLPMLAALFQKS